MIGISHPNVVFYEYSNLYIARNLIAVKSAGGLHFSQRFYIYDMNYYTECLDQEKMCLGIVGRYED